MPELQRLNRHLFRTWISDSIPYKPQGMGVLFYMIYIYMSKRWGMWFVCLSDGEGMAYDSLPLQGTGCPVPDIGYIYFVWK